jgi:hypothetical protein
VLSALLGSPHIAHVITAFGESNRRYRGTHRPLQGVGQGNGAAPAIWAVISAVLLSIMRDEGFGLNLLTAFSMMAIVIAGIAFVDDTDLLHAVTHPNMPGSLLIPQMQRVVDTWEGLLRATGGALRDEKLYCYLIEFKFQQGRWKYRSKQELSGGLDMNVVDSRSELRPLRVPLTRLEPSEARETLGVFTAMDGNWRRQKEALIALAQKCAEYLRVHQTDRDTTWYAFHTSFMKSLEYCLEAVCLSQQTDWDEIMSPLLGITLQ